MLSVLLLTAVTVKPSPTIFPVKGSHIAVSADGKTLAVSDGKGVYVHDAKNGKRISEVSRGLGLKPGPLLAVDGGFVVQLLGEKKKRFVMVAAGKAEPVPFRLPKDTDVPALNVAYSAQTMVGLLTPTDVLTDVLAWDFSQKPPVESPRTGIALHCWSIWASKKKAHALCEDGVHTFELDPPGNNNQVGAADETIKVPRDALSTGDGERVAWIANGELSVDDFSAEPRVKKSAKLPEGSIVTSLVFVPEMRVVAASLGHDHVVWVWDYGVDGFSKVKVQAPSQLAVSTEKGRVWVRTSAGVLRLDVTD